MVMSDRRAVETSPVAADEKARERLLSRKAELVRAALEVSQELVAVPDLGVLFERVVGLIKERFGYYHVQIFRHEPALGAVVLVCGHGQTGRDMLAAGHSLPMRRGIVGTAAATGQSVLAPDVSHEPGWIPNPHLPETKGELAVPIKLRGQVVGIIDAQSDTAGALGEDDRVLLETISGPIALAIASTALRQEMEDNLRALFAAQEEATARGWVSFRERGELPRGYLYDRVAARPVGELWEPAFGRVAERRDLVVDEPPDRVSGIAVSPLIVHDEFVGVLGAYADPGHPLSQQEIELVQMVSEQVAVALDNARMADATESALREAQTLYRIGELVSGQMDEPSVCAAVARALVEDVGYATATIHLLDADQDALVEAARAGVSDAPARPTLALSDTSQPAVRAVQGRRATIDSGASRPGSHRPGLPEGPPVDCVAAVPVLAGSVALGAIQVSGREALGLGDHDVRVLEGVAIQVGNALERARLLRQMQEALDAADAAARRYMSNAWDSYLEGHPVEGQTYVAGPEGVRREESPWLLEMQAAVESEQTVSRVVQSGHDHVASAVLAVPLRARGEVIGVVHLCREGTGQEWTQRERTLVEALVEECGEAIESERQFAHTRSTLAQTERMYEASQRIGAAADRREVLAVVLEIASSTPVDQVALFSFDAPATRGLPSAQELSAVWDREGAAPLASPGVRCSIDEVPFPYSMSRERSLVVPDLGQADRLDPDLRRYLASRGFRAFAAVPLAAGDEWLGYTLVLTRQVHSFTPGELRVYESVNRQAAIALRSARLYEEAQRRAHREQLIREITSRMRGTPDLETILSTAVEELGKAMGVSRAFVRLGTGHKQAGAVERARPETGTGSSDTENGA